MLKNNFNLYSLEKAKQIDDNQKIILQLDNKSEFLYDKPFSYNFDDLRQLHTAYILDFSQKHERFLKSKGIIKLLFERFDKIQLSFLEIFKNNWEIQNTLDNKTILNCYIKLIENQLNNQELNNALKNPTVFLPFINKTIEKDIIQHQKSLLYNIIIFDYINNVVIETDYIIYKQYSINQNLDYNNNFLEFIKCLKGHRCET